MFGSVQSGRLSDRESNQFVFLRVHSRFNCPRFYRLGPGLRDLWVEAWGLGIEGIGALRLFVLLPIVFAVCLSESCVAADPEDTGTGGAAPAVKTSAGLTLESLRGTKAGDNRIFLEYNRGGKVRWNTGWPGRVDMTGVSWDSGKPATAITPRHVVMAAHYSRKVGAAIVFHDREGKAHRRTLQKLESLRGKPSSVDIVVGLLDRPLPDQVKTYPLLKPKTGYADILAGGPVLITGQKHRLFVHQVTFLRDRVITFAHDSAYHESMRWMLTKGDSGYPTFMLVGGEPVLIETQTFGGPGMGPFYSTPICFDALQGAVRKLDPKYRIRTVSLDARFVQDAPNRIAARGKTYAIWNPDGSRKNPAVGSTSRRRSAKPVTPATPSVVPPADRKVPRVRRAPPPKDPAPESR